MYYELDETWIPFSSLMLKHIYNVLLICSDYDRFMLEEDGRVEEELYKEYTSLGLSSPPKITHTNNEKEALKELRNGQYDLVISMLDLGSGRVEALAEEVKNYNPSLPFIALSPSPDHRKAKVLKGENCPYIDYLFYWLGDPSLFLAMIKLIEDEINIEHDTEEADVEVILFVEDSVRFISSYLPEIYTLLIKQNRASIIEALNDWGVKLRMRGRPKIVLARTYDEAITLYDKYRENILGVISDLSLPSPWGKDSGGEHVALYVKNDNPELPVLIQSTDQNGSSIAKKTGSDFIWKLSPERYIALASYFRDKYNFGPFRFINPDNGETIATAVNMKELQETMMKVPLSVFEYHVRRNDFSRWLRGQSLFSLASTLKPVTTKRDGSDSEKTRELIYETIKKFRKDRTRGSIAVFKRENYDETYLFTRLGKGSLGGKGRGLAFLASEMKASKISEKYPEVYLSIPRTIAISTEIFDSFLALNGFTCGDYVDKDDKTILRTFLDARVPEDFTLDMKRVLEVIHAPISVRSSSLLEDSHFYPFAGVYETCMIPNIGNDEERLDDLLKAIKTVWASTYFSRAREYLKSTSHAVEEEKMAVVIQQITGSMHDNYWLPNISGVARSLDYYPQGNRKAEDGIGMLAFGMGKTVVDEGSAFRFCPAKPQIPISSLNGRASMQRKFYALDRTTKFDPEKDIDNLVHLPLSLSYNWTNAIAGIMSTIRRDGFVSEDPREEGFKSLTFNGVVKYGLVKLPEIIHDILELGTRTMAGPVEIEYAVNTEHSERPDFSILQLRPISSTDRFENIEITKEEENNALIFSNHVMGNGRVDTIRDMIIFKENEFKRSEMAVMAAELEELNAMCDDEYILVAAGRLGSSDNWLGIPVTWSAISHAHVIVETGVKELQAEPSEGTHFFQNMTSLGCLYLTVNPLQNKGRIDYDKIYALKGIKETKHFIRIRRDKPFLVKADGAETRAIISLGEEKND